MSGRATNIVILLLALVVNNVHQCCGQLPTPSGVNFIGIGYNILDGNPEGGEQTSGGVDPGLLVYSRRIFELTYDDNKLSSDNRYLVPDEVSFFHRSSASTSSSRTTFYGESSYASKLSAQVDVSGSYSGLFAGVQFSASTRYERITSRISTQGSVFLATQTISNRGNARYLTELAQTDGYELNNGFVADACSLPTSYSQADYMQFLDDWGTHVVTEVDLGKREGTNSEENRSSFVIYAATEVSSSVTASGPCCGYSASLAVNMDTFNSALESGLSFGSRYSSYTVGSDRMNEPISLQLIGMHEVFEERFWTQLSTYIATGHCSNSFQRSSVRNNILRAMQDYASYRSIQQRGDDSQIVIPLTWPDGTYGLPKPTSGCPNKDFTWIEGYRYHDTEDHNSNNQWSLPLDVDGWWAKNNMKHYFCMKTTSITDSNSHWIWPSGSYCIYKRDDCPSGFTEGSILWDDEDDNNHNRVWGTLPDGSYGINTKMYFCCRNDGVIDREIFLPTDDSFILFPRYQHCQKVHGMTATDEWFRWDNEDDDNDDSQTNVHPYEGLQDGRHNVVLHFCYYRKKEDTSNFFKIFG